MQEKCGIGNICTNGVCQTGTGNTYCSGVAINTSIDDLNCGKCSNACSGDLGCISGTCDIKYITFGHYEQDNNTSNGKEPIRWLTLDKNSSGQYLVVSEKVLDLKPYNTTYISITWEKSTIRSWLNGYGASYNTVGNNYTTDNFIDTAFTEAEKAKIIASNVPAHANPSYSTSPGNATTDKIFLLSIVEANNHFANDTDRRAMATLYVGNNDAYGTDYLTSDCIGANFQMNKCSATWWLRSPGFKTDNAADVHSSGSVDYDGSFVNYDHFGVRPAMWVQF